MKSTSAITKKTESESCAKPWTPRSDQRNAVAWLLKHCNAGLFADPGAGKTSVTLKTFQVLKSERLIKRALVIAPLRVCYDVWPTEVQDWLEFSGIRVTVLHGKDKDDRLDDDVDIFVINPDGLQWLLEAGKNRLKKLGCDMLVIDESSKFKYTNTKRFKLLKPFLTWFKRRIILTGSPNPNGYTDLFGQIFILDMGNALGRYVTHFRNKYFDSTGFGGYTYVLRDGADKEIQKAIKPLVMRVDTSDYVDLPTVVDNVIRVELPPKARKIYDDLEDEMFAILDNGHTVAAVSAGAASNKCRQVANGGLYYHADADESEDDSLLAIGARQSAVIHDAKTEALIDLVEELQGSPLLIAYEFQHDLDRITAALGKKTSKSAKPVLPYIGGGVTPKVASDIIRDWNAGKIAVLPAHPAAMGHGLNLQKSNCHHVCHYGINWDFELYDQFIRRIRRPGNKSADVFNHLIVARNTTDEAKLRALRGKEKTQKGLLDALRTYAQKRRVAANDN